MDWSWNSNLSLNLKPLTEKRVCNWETREVFSFLVTSPSSHNYRRLIPTCFFPRARLISFWRQWLEVPSYGWMALVLPWAVGKAGMAEAACPLQGFLMWDTPHPVADFSQSGVCTTVFRESMSLYIASFLFFRAGDGYIFWGCLDTFCATTSSLGFCLALALYMCVHVHVCVLVRVQVSL